MIRFINYRKDFFHYLKGICLFSIILLLLGCSKQNTRQILIDTYNETVIAYKEAMEGIEQQKDTLDEETYHIFYDMNKQLNEYRKIISTGNRLSKEETKEILDWLKECKKWAECAKQIWSIEK